MKVNKGNASTISKDNCSIPSNTNGTVKVQNSSSNYQGSRMWTFEWGSYTEKTGYSKINMYARCNSCGGNTNIDYMYGGTSIAGTYYGMKTYPNMTVNYNTEKARTVEKGHDFGNNTCSNCKQKVHLYAIQSYSGYDIGTATSYYVEGVYDVRLCCTLPINTMTSGEKTSVYGSSEGWNILN